jgi:hypothetical protein
VLPLHHGHSGDGRDRTGGLSPDKRALYPTELRPLGGSAGGIRTRDLELMRLARTAAPPPRKSDWQESHPRAPASGAGVITRFDHGGVAGSGGRARTCAPAVNSRVSYLLDHTGVTGPCDVTGRGRTCDAPRFKRALYRLSYGHVIRSMFIATRCQPRSTTVA